MFKTETTKEIKNSLFRIALFVLVDFLWIAGMYLIFRPLVIVAVVYTLFSITMIYPQIKSIRFMRSLNSNYNIDKPKVLSMLKSRIEALEEVVIKQDEPLDLQAYENNPKTQSRMERGNRKSSDRFRGQYKLYVSLKEILSKEM